jgi:hypothetical protein
MADLLKKHNLFVNGTFLDAIFPDNTPSDPSGVGRGLSEDIKAVVKEESFKILGVICQYPKKEHKNPTNEKIDAIMCEDPKGVFKKRAASIALIASFTGPPELKVLRRISLHGLDLSFSSISLRLVVKLDQIKLKIALRPLK